MKAIVIYEAGGPEKLIYTDVPTPKVKPGWSLVKVMGRGVNHSEIFTRDGVKPAVTALTILAIPPVLLNTTVGFRSIPDFMIESAQGIGMTERELLFKVRIPGALPMMLAGIRTALVEIVASTTLAAKIGWGGLGTLLFEGLRTINTPKILWGSVLSAILEVSINKLLKMVEKTAVSKCL